MSDIDREGAGIVGQSELTASGKKGYHGSMAELSTAEKIEIGQSSKTAEVNIPKGKDREVSGQTGLAEQRHQPGNNIVSIQNEIKPVNHNGAVGLAHRNNLQAQAEQRDAAEQKGGDGLLKSIWQAIFEILKNIFNFDDDSKVKDMINNSYAMKAVTAYASFKPQERWNAQDYARVLCIIGSDNSQAGLTIKDHLMTEATRRYGGDIFLERLKKIDSRSQFLSDNDLRDATEGEKKSEEVRRAGAMHYDLWKEMRANGDFGKLSIEKLREMQDFWRGYRGGSIDLRGIDADEVLESIAGELNLRGAGASGKQTGDIYRRHDGAIAQGAGSGPADSGGKVQDDDLDNGTNDHDTGRRSSGGGGGNPPSGGGGGNIPGGPGGGGGDLLQEVQRIGTGVEKIGSNTDIMVDQLTRINETLFQIRDSIDKLAVELRACFNDEKTDTEKYIKQIQERYIERDNEYREYQQKKIEYLKKISENDDKAYILRRLNEHENGLIRKKCEEEKALISKTYEEKIRGLTDQTKKQGADIDALKNEINRIKEEEDKRKAELERYYARHYQEEERAKIDPWERHEKELYEGTINEVLEERMMRIKLFSVWADGKGRNAREFEEAGIDPGTLPDQETMERLHQAYLRYYAKGGESKVTNEISKYMGELKRWTKVILKNAGSSGRLTISPGQRDFFERILGTSIKVSDYGDERTSDDEKIKIFRLKMSEAVRDLSRERFTDFFRSKGDWANDYAEARVKAREGSVPKSIWELCALIQSFYSGEGFGTGEEHELVNENGELVLKNLLYWVYIRTWRNSDNNSQSAINSLQQVSIRTTYLDLSLSQILEVPQYTSYREFEMEGDARRIKETGSRNLNVGWGAHREHPDFKYKDRQLWARWVWQFDNRHNDGVSFMDNAVRLERGEWVKALYKIIREGNYFRSGYLALWHQMPSTSGDEYEKFYKEYQQGSVGKAGRDMVQFYNHMTDFTEFYMKRDDNSKAIGVKNYSDNMAYQSLGMDGSSAFLLTLAEQALFYSAQRKEFRNIYKNYIVQMMNDLQKDTKKNNTTISPEKERELGILVKKYTEAVKGIEGSKFDEMKMNFNTCEQLYNLQRDIETSVLGKELVNDETWKTWQGGTERIVSRSQVKDMVRKRMRKGLKEHFFDKIKEVETEHREDSGEAIKLGDLKVKVDKSGDEKGRIVTDKEYGELEKNGVKVAEDLTVGKILDEFANMADCDELDFAKEYRRICDIKNDIKRKSEEEKLMTKYEKALFRNERLAMALMTKAASIERKDLNWFRQARPPDAIKSIIRTGLSEGLGEIYNLREFERSFADDGAYYSVEQFLIAARNNTADSSAVDQGSWWLRTAQVWENSAGFSKKSPFMYQLLRLAPGTLWEFTEARIEGRKSPMTVAEFYQGSGGRPKSGNKMVERCIREQSMPRKNMDISRDYLQTVFNEIFFYGDQFLKELTEEDILEFGDCIKLDATFSPPKYVFDREKAVKMMKETWNPIFRIFDKANTNYDRKIVVDGREITVAEAMLGPKVKQTIKTLKDYYEMRSTYSLRKETRDQYRALAQEIEKSPAVAVLAYMAAQTLKEHTQIIGGKEQTWELQHIYEFMVFLEEYMRKPGEKALKDKVEYLREPVSRLPFGLLNEVMEDTTRTNIQKIAFWQLFWEMIAGIAEGIVLRENLLTELGESYMKAVQPVRAVS